MEQNELKQLSLDYKNVFNSEAGQRVLLDLKKRCFANVSTFDKDPYNHAFNEGTRATLLTILSMIELDLKHLGGEDAVQK